MSRVECVHFEEMRHSNGRNVRQSQGGVDAGLRTWFAQIHGNSKTQAFYNEKLVIPDGVSHSASQEKSNAFGSSISDNKNVASSKLGITGTSIPLPLGATLVSSVSDGCGASRAFSDAIFDTGSAHRSKQ